MHLVWVHCIEDGGVSPSVCPEYYYAHKVKRMNSVPAPHPPPPPPTWRPPLWASKECDQHVSDEDKYLDKNFVNQEIQHVAALPSGVEFRAGHVYCKDGVPVPEGKWAVTLPSDDNKLRRKWYKVRLSRRREGLSSRRCESERG
jgi:hypothetical protein